MAYGEIEYNEEGLPMCEICGKHFKRVVSHARQKHGINEKEYKLTFGFDLGKGICSKESAELSRYWNKQYYNVVVKVNLLDEGRGTRFKKGDPGRTKDKISAQTMRTLKQRAFKKSKI